ncbi:MAG: TolB family protein, partial [Rhodothermales bacterium]
RYQSAVEIPSDLRALDLATTGTTKLMTTAATRPVAQAEAPSRPAIPWRVAAPAAVALALVAAGFLGWLLKPAPAPEPQPVARFSVTLPSTERFTRTGRHVIAFSPDGTRLVHTANGQLHLRRLDQLETSTILGTVEDIREPFFSPDGQWVAFEHVYTERLMKIAVTGGAPVPLCEVGGLFGASWGPDDMIVYGQGAGGIWRVSAAGGTPEELIAPDSTRQDLFHGPQVLPGGKAVLFTLRPEGSASWNEAQIVVASLETGARTVLIDGGTDARYLPTGHLVYVHENVLLARPFDADRLAWTGSPVALVENVSHPTFSGVAGFSVSGTGSLVYIPDRSDDAAGWEMVWINRQGALTPVIEEQRLYYSPSLSPDGRQIAVQVSDPEDGSDDVWIYGVARGAPNRLTFGGSDTQPIWTPDGTRVTYSAYRNGDSDIYWRPADRSGEAELLWGGEHHQFAYSWSPDGRFLTFDELHPETGDDIWVLDMADTTATVFLNTAAFEENAVFSPPDGKWLAYHSDET